MTDQIQDRPAPALSTPSVGQIAPDFTLPSICANLQEETLTREGFRSRWLVLLFYPRDFSFVCPTELIEFSAEIEQFESRNADVLGISIDSIETHRNWLSTSAEDGGVQGLRFSLASDVSGDICKAYGLWRAHDDLPNRGLFLIDPDGVLRYSVVFDISVGRSVEDVIRVLDALQSGGLCPANWKGADGVLDVDALLKPGRVLAHYRIERTIGLGGFGRVLAADDIRLGRKVALKVLGKQSDAPEERLLDEARMAARVNHPNVCTIYAVDVIDTLPTIVMEYIDGPSLSAAIEMGISRQRFQTIASKVASGLAAAHSQEVIHGDIKPANVLLRSESDPVLVDFGLARPRVKARTRSEVTQPRSGTDLAASEATAEAVPTEEKIGPLDATIDLRIRDQEPFQDSGVRFTDGISGTPAYMSPEQARGQLLCPKSDVFSLGLLFIEMLTGKAPLKSMKALDILRTLQDKTFLETLSKAVPESDRGLFEDVFELAPANRPTVREVLSRLV